MITITPVIDSPEFVFHNWSDNVLNREFMDYVETDLTNPAIRVTGRLLAEEWGKRGCRMVPVRQEMYNRISVLTINIGAYILPGTQTTYTVWDAVAAKLNFDDIVTEAHLTSEYAAFVRAQPDYNH